MPITDPRLQLNEYTPNWKDKRVRDRVRYVLNFIEPVSSSAASNVKSYSAKSWTYLYHVTYGSPETDTKDLNITEATVSPDRLSVRLVIDGMRAGYVHQLDFPGVKSESDESLLHTVAYYTLNQIPAK